jgi:hypothetical protein
MRESHVAARWLGRAAGGSTAGADGSAAIGDTAADAAATVERVELVLRDHVAVAAVPGLVSWVPSLGSAPRAS